MQWAKSVHSELGAYAVGGWSFDNITGNTVLDDSGNGNNGTIYGATQVDGVVGKALSFDGVNDYVSVGNGVSLRYNNNFTVSMWINPKGNHLGAYGGLWAEYSTDGRNRMFVGDNGSLLAQYYIGGVLKLPASPAGSIITNQWSYVVLTYNGAEIVFWVNGVKQIPVAATGLLNSVSNNNREIGRATAVYQFNGIIDDVRIYKEALTISQIQQIYAQNLKTHRSLAKLDR